MDGLHLTADLAGCDAPAALMTDGQALAELCREAVRASGLQPVGELFHRFEPAADGGEIQLTETEDRHDRWLRLADVQLAKLEIEL